MYTTFPKSQKKYTWLNLVLKLSQYLKTVDRHTHEK